MSIDMVASDRAVKAALETIWLHFGYVPSGVCVSSQDVVSIVEDACIRHRIPTTVLPSALSTLLHEARNRVRLNSSMPFDLTRIKAATQG